MRVRLLLWTMLMGMLLSHPNLAAGAHIVKGPYLIYPGDNTRMTIHWQLDATTTCGLAWGADATCTSATIVTAENNATDHQHSVTIRGLAPGKRCFYRLNVDTLALPCVFLAAPLSDATDLKFFAYGDTRKHIKINDSLCAAMRANVANDPSWQTFLLHTGDWVGGDDENHWTNEFFDRGQNNLVTLMEALPIQGCIGNHEGKGIYYRKYWPYPYVNSRFYWSFDYGPAHFVIVDQYDQNDGPSQEQVTWIRNDLMRSKKEWKFLVYHEPAWSATGAHDYNSRARDVLGPLCKQYGIDACISGHNHFYSRCEVNGVQYLTLGGGGASSKTPDSVQPDYVVKSASEHHYAKFEIHGKNLKVTAVTPEGEVIDQFTVVHDACRDHAKVGERKAE